MTATCKRCGAMFAAKSARRAYCDACRRVEQIERAFAGNENQNRALFEERRKRNLTVREMAEWLEVHPSTYYNLEHNGAAPGEALRRRIADKLGQPAETYFGPLFYGRVCRDCGTYYHAEHAKSRLCPDCTGRAQAERPPRRGARTSRSLQEVARAAREAGMSYGKYVAGKEGGAV